MSANTNFRTPKSYNYRLRGWLPSEQDSKVLDLGCGDGTISSFFREKFSSVTGVDLNKEKLAKAETLGITTCCEDVMIFLSKTEQDFDLIYAFDLLEHLEKKNIVPFLKSCLEKTRPGGRLILQMPNPISPLGYGVVQGDLTHVFPLSPTLAKTLLTEVGFENIELRETGPSLWGYSLSATVRFLIWRVFRLWMRFINFIESGERANLPLTRVYLITGKKPSIRGPLA